MRILIAALLLANTAFSQGKTAPAQGPPPRHLTHHADGRFSANSDPADLEHFEVYVVKTGDTLSLIAGQVLKNPRLWPQIWEQNEHIVNPHWIYPNDKILIRPVTLITEAVPPSAPEPAPESPVAIAAAARSPARFVPRTAVPALASPRQQSVIQLTPPRVVPEVKADDLYCSGSIRTAPITQSGFKVISKFDSDGSVLATDADYIYLSQGSENGVNVGATYQVVRPTTRIDNLGLHYLDVAQVRVVIAQADFAVGRVIHNCEAVEVGDFMIPFQRINLPPIPRHRPFSPFMAASGQAKGAVVTTKESLLNYGSSFKTSGTTPGIHKGNLAPLERGIATEGTIAYVDLGQGDGVKPGDIFIVYRNVELSSQEYQLPKEIRKLEHQRNAIGELMVLKVGERASTALVTYATAGVSQGDVVERR